MASSETRSFGEYEQDFIEQTRVKMIKNDLENKSLSLDLRDLFEEHIGQTISISGFATHYMIKTTGEVQAYHYKTDEGYQRKLIDYQPAIIAKAFEDGVAVDVGEDKTCPILLYGTIDFVPPGSDMT